MKLNLPEGIVAVFKKSACTGLIAFLLVALCSEAQVYTEKQTRHRFAQLNLGLDYQVSNGGSTSYLNTQGVIEELELGALQKPRILIGGTHFWGHADFYIAIPIWYPSFESEGQEIDFSTGVETVLKYYPLRIKHNRVRPFIGAALAPFNYEQSNQHFTFGNGPELNHTSIPLLAGLTFNRHNWLIELSALWNYDNRRNYFVAPRHEVHVTTPPLYFSLSGRYMIETTLSAEDGWESGETAELTEKLAQGGNLNAFYVAAGMSSAFWIGSSSYNESLRPYIEKYSTSIMPELGIGYYLHKPDMNISMSYRGYRTTTDAYGTEQFLRRRSVGLEVTKFLWDYHGFVPFIGPVATYENLKFREDNAGITLLDLEESSLSYGLTFGWDIRPNRLQSWILRTNLRWFPDLEMDVAGGNSIVFDNIEFNFIQLVVFPGRMF